MWGRCSYPPATFDNVQVTVASSDSFLTCFDRLPNPRISPRMYRYVGSESIYNLYRYLEKYRSILISLCKKLSIHWNNIVSHPHQYIQTCLYIVTTLCFIGNTYWYISWYICIDTHHDAGGAHRYIAWCGGGRCKSAHYDDICGSVNMIGIIID